MGLKSMLQKMAMGASTEESNANKEIMRQIFNKTVKDGDTYKILYCHSEATTDALVVKVTKHNNYIVGYKEGSVCIIPISANLKESGALYEFSKENASMSYSAFSGCTIGNNDLAFNFLPVEYEPGINRGNNCNVAVIQKHSEVVDFQKFFKAGF